MTLENIQLTEAQLQEFYSSHLVITKAERSNMQEKEIVQPSLTGITGKNNKQFVWIVNEPSYPFLSDDDFQFLSDILTACKMNMNDIALVNYAHNKSSLQSLAATLHAKQVVISATAQQWMEEEADNYLLQDRNGYQLFITEDLSVLRNDKVKKSKLWLALKQMLSL